MVKKLILPLMILFLAISGVSADICNTEDFETFNGGLYGFDNWQTGAPVFTGTCTYAAGPAWDASGTWCVANAEGGGDEGGVDDAAHIIIQNSIPHMNIGWFTGMGCSGFADDQILRFKFRIKFDSNWYWTSRDTNKFILWGTGTSTARHMILIKNGYWNAGACTPNGDTRDKCTYTVGGTVLGDCDPTNPGPPCTDEASCLAVCVEDNVQYQCLDGNQHVNSGGFSVNQNVDTPCGGPLTLDDTNTLPIDEWLDIQIETKTGPNGFYKMWVNNNDYSEPNACTGSLSDCPASATYGYPAGINSPQVTNSSAADYTAWEAQINIGNYVTAAVPVDMGFYLDDLIVERDEAWDNTWHDGGSPPTPDCDDTLDNDGDGLVDTADPGCGSASDTNELDPDTECDDGIDNDLDGLTDLADTYGCTGASTALRLQDDDENNCGDASIDSPEICDGALLNGNDCTDVGSWVGGTLGCTSDCLAYDTSQCIVPTGEQIIFEDDFESTDFSSWNDCCAGNMTVVNDPGNCAPDIDNPGGSDYCARATTVENTTNGNFVGLYFGDHYAMRAGYPNLPEPLREIYANVSIKWDAGYTFQADEKIMILNASGPPSDPPVFSDKWRKYQIILEAMSDNSDYYDPDTDSDDGEVGLQNTRIYWFDHQPCDEGLDPDCCAIGPGNCLGQGGNNYPSCTDPLFWFHANYQNVGAYDTDALELVGDTWHDIKIYAKMNDVGQQNGIIQVWVDDVLIINHSDVMMGCDETMGWNNLIMGMGTTPATGPGGYNVYYDNVYVSTNDPAVEPGNDQQPSNVNNISIIGVTVE